MSGNPAVVMRLVASAYAEAEKAGAIIWRDRGRRANDLQTLADRLVQQSMCASLSKSFPKITIIGEEDLPEEAVKEDLIESSQSEEILQVLSIGIHPLFVCSLQLTCHLISGLLEHVTVLIGISYGGKAIAGVINQPFNYQLGTETADMWGMPGLGAFGFELQEVPDGRHTVDAMVPHDVNRVGGAGNKIVQLVEGKASACVFASLGTKKWDTCAPEAILHALRGKQHPLDHSEMRCDANVKHMNSAGVLATLRNHQYYTSKVPQSVLQALIDKYNLQLLLSKNPAKLLKHF
uniref:3'(2'),5'-bisphosphate nucleotidase 1 n=1 Tax=Oncorhynchus tshawytscha TaxID=74940 RepID=A0A8C8D884_ONCTS